MIDLLDRFAGQRVLVVGDVMLDRAVIGTARRLSPEAPVPVVANLTTNDSLGGAANVAVGVRALGSIVRLVGVTGDDAERARVLELLDALDIETSAVLAIVGRPTTLKTRVVADGHQVVRLDVEEASDIEPSVVLPHLREALESGVDVVILSDYAKGVLSGQLVTSLIDEARRRNVPVIVDPKHPDPSRYAGAAVVTPNHAEFARWCGEDVNDDLDTVGRLAVSIAQRHDIDAIVVTLGSRGMLVCSADGSVDHVPGRSVSVFDVTGAGDSVTAAIGVAMASGLSVQTACRLANVAGSIAVSRHGTVVVAIDDLRSALGSNATGRLLSRAELLERAESWRTAGRRIVFTNGCFDIVHRGHLAVLQACRQEGDIVVVGLNSDESVRRLKGDGRPRNSSEDRALLLAELRTVDAVVVFDEDDPGALVDALVPDVIVKGGDYRADEVIGGRTVEARGGRVVIVPTLAGYSTTSLVTEQR